MNINRIANLHDGGERESNTAQSVYSSCHDTTRTQILNCSQGCRNRKVETAVWFQPGQKTLHFMSGQGTHLTKQRGSGFWTGLEQYQTHCPVQTPTAVRVLRLIGNTNSMGVIG
jgi:hypothetical protein